MSVSPYGKLRLSVEDIFNLLRTSEITESKVSNVE